MTATLRTVPVSVAGVHAPVLVGGTGRPGEAVLFVHGNPGSGADWLPLMRAVAEFATVLAPDLPGFAGADKRPDQGYTVADYADFIDGVVEHFGLRQVHLVAHDFGGPFALTWAAKHPDRVASVVVINTGVLLDYRWHTLARLWRRPVIGEVTMLASVPKVVKAILRHQNPGLPPECLEAVAGHLNPSATKRAVLALYRSTSVARQMDALVAPLRARDPDALVIWGDADAYLPAALAHRQLRAFPRAEVHVLPGVGHWAWLEQPTRVTELVKPFLRSRVGARAEKP